MWMVRERCETLLDVETLYIPYSSIYIFAKSTILWLDNEAISGTLVAIFGPILSLGYMSLFKYLYQRYETHPIFKGLENGKISYHLHYTKYHWYTHLL